MDLAKIDSQESQIGSPRRLGTQTLLKGLLLLQAAFPSLQLDKERISAMELLWADLNDAEFERGLVEFCRRQKEIYPGTNLIAHIRAYGRSEDRVWGNMDLKYGEKNA